MKLASKQLLAIGVTPAQVIELEQRAREKGVELRVLVQQILRDWLHDHRPSV